ncbi:MAG: SET domain-containing protein-lysine N-methyltransferase [Rickettsia endosymbiont of Ixodes persulcatus]|nr:SET domain-containing protein-lysine N-methyltransferase [Rickettsia endosymbiont of Ixodes persulcatus]
MPDFLEIKFCEQINSYGLYATKEILQGELIGLYASLIIPLNSASDSHYRFSYTHKHGLDASINGNYTRFINSASSLNDRNLKAVLVSHDNSEEIAIFALKNIRVGQQCLFFYGDGYFNHFNLVPIKLTPDT